MVKLRLKRYGKKREATYRIVAIQSHARREGRPLQEVGFYNPRTKATSLNTADILSWLRKGAQPTDTVRYLLNKAKIYDMLSAGLTGETEPLVTVIAEPKAKQAVMTASEQEASEASEE